MNLNKYYNKLLITFLFTVSLLHVSAQVMNLDYFKSKIFNAYNSGASAVTLEEGTFYMNYNSGDEFFELDNMNNFTINANNTRFIFTSGERAFTIKNCENLKIKGLSIDYWPLPFTQGTITAKEGSKVIVDIHDGYAGRGEGLTNKFRSRAYIIEPDSKSLRADIFPTGSLSENWINSRQVEITLTKPKNINNVEINDRIVFFYDSYGGSGHTFLIDYCTDLEFSDLTINSSIGRTFLEVTGGGNTVYENVKVTYGDIPEGGSEPRLFTSVAAGIRTIGLTKGPQIINCLFEGLGDDGCNIQGDYFLIFETGNNYINIVSKRTQYFEVGDTIVCANRQGVEIGMAVLESISETSKPSDFDSKRTEYLEGTSYENSGGTFNNYYRFNYDGELNAEEGFYVYNINKVGAGCRIENTTYRNIRARGILLKAPNSIIINNHVENITHSGILVAPEIVFWLESGPSKNLEISGNQVINAYTRPQVLNGTHSAAVVIACEGEDINGNKIFTPGIIHSNISFTNNTIENTPGPGLLVSSTSNIAISNNLFKNTNNRNGWQGGVNVGVDVGAALYITQSDSVFLCDNEVVSQGVNGTSSSTFSETVTNFFIDCESLTTNSIDPELVQNKNALKLFAYPNPFDNNVTIELNLREPGDYSLSIYDNSGRKIDTVFSGFLPRGKTTFNWSIDYPGGNQMYICVLKNEATNKLVSRHLCNIRSGK